MEAVSPDPIRTFIAQADGVDLKPVFEDDEQWERFRAELEPLFHADAVFAWVAPGVRTERVGMEGLRAGWIEFMEAFESYHSRTEEVRVLGDDRFVMLVVQMATLPGGNQVEMKAAGLVRMRDGKVAAVDFNSSREDALG